jgi:hypothetical protein
VASGDPNPAKSAANLLRRALASSHSSPDARIDACPDPEILAAYSERSLDADETAHYELHFAQCPSCRDQLAAMVRAAAPAPRPPRLAWIWTWGWIALAPVTAVLLIAVIFIAWQSRQYSASAPHEQPLVAMSRADESVANAPLAQSAPAQQPPVSASREYAPAPVTRAKPDILAAPKLAPVVPATPDQTVETKSESSSPQVTTAPVEKDLTQRPAAGLTMANRNYTDLKAPSSAPAAPRPGKGAVNRSADQVHAQPKAVTVESESATITTQDSLADNSAVSPAAAAPLPRNRATTYSSLASGAMNQAVAVAPRDQSVPMLVQSPDPQVLWRISGGRYVERSADAGATWHTQWSNATAQVVAGSAPSADTCWLVGSGGIVLLATDARRWHTVTPPEVDDFTAVSASDAQSATITTKDGRQFKTRDGGKHWSPAP